MTPKLANIICLHVFVDTSNQIIRNGAPGSFVETTKEEYWKF